MARSHEGPAEKLVGQSLDDNWIVERRLRRDYGATGETRSCCYLAVSTDGTQYAFVKAFDFHREELQGDTDALEKMVREFNHERDIHQYSTSKRLSRVTRFLGAGKIVIENVPVHYIICEWADKCLREMFSPGDSEIPIHERFVLLRMVASAVAQLHSIGIAHQDIKPSNAVWFANAGQGRLKITDLGSSSCEHLTSPPHDDDILVGQPNYAPYELLYAQPTGTWHSRRIGCDAFLLGNLCFTQIVGGSLTHLVLHGIPPAYRHTEYRGPYSEVIPFLDELHHDLIPAFLSEKLPEALSEGLSELVLGLCNPDPHERGFSKRSIRLDRVTSKLDLLAAKARVLNRDH